MASNYYMTSLKRIFPVESDIGSDGILNVHIKAVVGDLTIMSGGLRVDPGKLLETEDFTYNSSGALGNPTQASPGLLKVNGVGAVTEPTTISNVDARQSAELVRMQASGAQIPKKETVFGFDNQRFPT
jgi:hypothetical protein